MRVLFVNKFLDKEAIFRTPLGIMSLSAMIKDNHDVKIVDPLPMDFFSMAAQNMVSGVNQKWLVLPAEALAVFCGIVVDVCIT